jgi:hypothetical protein
MAYGFEQWKLTAAGKAAAAALRRNAQAVTAAAKAGAAPIRVIAPEIEEHLGNRLANSRAGRLVREWLGPTFRVRGRIKWPREHGTESGAVYLHRG